MISVKNFKFFVSAYIAEWVPSTMLRRDVLQLYAECIALGLKTDVFTSEELHAWVEERVIALGHEQIALMRKNPHVYPYVDHMNGMERYVAYAGQCGVFADDELRVLRTRLDHGMTVESFCAVYARDVVEETLQRMTTVQLQETVHPREGGHCEGC